MSARISPARRAAFLRAVAETGNQRLAAERAKVSLSWVQLQRSTDPGFKADVAAAVAQARDALAKAPDRVRSTKPPRGWGYLAGEELVVRGTPGRRVQVVRARLRQWTPRIEARFLALVAQTCNLRLSLREVGLSAQSLHEHRKRWPAFDDACEEMLARGYGRIDAALPFEALRSLDPADYETEEAPVIAPMSASDAIRLVRLHERRRWEAARGVGPGGRVRRRRAGGS